MSGYTKLFNSILYSTIWQEPKETKLLWITMLAMSDKEGQVAASVPGLAKMAGISIEECEVGLLSLLSPDLHSRTKEHEGRRIQVIDGGWVLLNHAKYRALLSKEERKEYNRRKQAEHRAKQTATINDASLTVNNNKQCQHITEADTDTKAKKKRGAKRAAPTDPRSQHPAIQALQRLAHTCPDRGVWDQLIVLLGDSPDVALLGRCYSEWVGRGFKKTNWLGVVEWYCQGIPSTARGTGQAKRSADVGASPSAPSSKKCGNPARFNFTLPGSAPSVCCEECLAIVTETAGALGWTVQTSPLEGEALCP